MSFSRNKTGLFLFSPSENVVIVDSPKQHLLSGKIVDQAEGLAKGVAFKVFSILMVYDIFPGKYCSANHVLIALPLTLELAWSVLNNILISSL